MASARARIEVGSLRQFGQADSPGSTAAGWRIWVGAMCLVQALDFLTTTVGVRAGLPELNPLMAAALERGDLAALGFKALILAAIIAVVSAARPRYPLAVSAFRVLTVLTLLVVALNAVCLLGAPA